MVPEGFETYAQAKARRERKVRLLSKGDAAQRRVAEKLRQCRKARRCDSGACDVCVGLSRLGLLRQARTIFVQSPHWTRASVVPAGFLFAVGQLKSVDLDALAKKIDKRLERSSLRDRIVFAGIDVSLNLQDSEILGWQLHLYLLIQGENTLRLREAIKAAFPPEPTAPMPYDFDEISDPSNRITYLLKAIFRRRCRYSRANGRAGIAAQPLKSPELKELLLFLDQYPIGTRLVLRGLRRNGRRLTIINENRRPKVSVACRREKGVFGQRGTEKMHECSKISNFTSYGSYWTGNSAGSQMSRKIKRRRLGDEFQNDRYRLCDIVDVFLRKTYVQSGLKPAEAQSAQLLRPPLFLTNSLKDRPFLLCFATQRITFAHLLRVFASSILEVQ